ncbi:M23 family metallopeptidase [Paenibacillus caui]|uniref:M23 family metallopeptidase n=1 Tax=Paenibacillus caui TaxID=2873927 RepID=UPI001CA89086|nr:M23 family metallopeptidase [Paenibacillus caui]
MRVGRSSQGMTLLILRDGQVPVRQLYLSKPVMVCVPMAALLSISSLIISLHLRSADRIAGLEHQLLQQQLTMEAVVSDKNEALRRLQSQVVSLSKESKSFKARLGTVSALQEQLEHFLEKNKLSVSAGNSTKLSSLSWDRSRKVGGEFIAVHDVSTDALARETEDDFSAMNTLLDEMQKQIPAQISTAQAHIEALSGTPSLWPTPSRRITSSFGYRRDPFTGRAAFHAGIDIGGQVGDPVYAAAAGKVTAVQQDGSRGKYIIIRHPNGLETWYMHLNSAEVRKDEDILKGQLIGQLGNTGRSTGPHLHFQVMKKDEAVDPLPYMN